MFVEIGSPREETGTLIHQYAAEPFRSNEVIESVPDFQGQHFDVRNGEVRFLTNL
jgi:hypothetical protein